MTPQRRWQLQPLAAAAVLAIAAMLLGAVPADGKFLVESHTLIVKSDSFHGTFDSAIANFGLPQYGGSLSGEVKYISDDSHKGCQAFDRKVYSSNSGSLPVIALVDRGDCLFTNKVWYAQLAGAAAVLVADDKQESLITMDSSDDDNDQLLSNITIPSALVQKNTSDAIKKALAIKNFVTVKMDWSESLPHPDDRVEYELWTNSNDECGLKCDMQTQFVEEFKGVAQTLERGGYTKFQPHYITWYCPPNFVKSKNCMSQCINNGRYCAPDPDQDFDSGYDGKEVVVENLRQLCVWQHGNDTGRPWVWWDYVTDFKERCKMKQQTYNKQCAEDVVESLGLDLRKIRDCIGHPEKDQENALLKREQEAQVGNAKRSDVTILPTLVINQKQYRGKLDSKAVLKALCSGFEETTDPPQCLGQDIQTNECLVNNGGCWHGVGTYRNFTACQDTFRGKVCKCPYDTYTGVAFIGDGYFNCTPAGKNRCNINNGGCWEAVKDGHRYTACQDDISGTGCKCPAGFSGDGVNCKDIDECAASSTVCKCNQCHCTNTFGSYECSCSGNAVYIKDEDTCISKVGSASDSAGWVATLVVVAFLAVVGVAGYVVYKYRIRSYMDSEIRAIMAQYMPLDSQNEHTNRPLQEDT